MGRYFYHIILMLLTIGLAAIITYGSRLLGIPLFGHFMVIVIILLNCWGHLLIVYLLGARRIKPGSSLTQLIEKLSFQTTAGKTTLYSTSLARRKIILVKSWFSPNIIVLGSDLLEKLDTKEQIEVLRSSALLFNGGVISLRTALSLFFGILLLPFYTFDTWCRQGYYFKRTYYFFFYLFLPIRWAKVWVEQMININRKLFKVNNQYNCSDSKALDIAMRKLASSCDHHSVDQLTLLLNDLLHGLFVGHKSNVDNPMLPAWWSTNHHSQQSSDNQYQWR